MYILALGGSAHSYSACIVNDGTILCAVEEERLNGRRHSLFAEGSMELARCRAASYCLQALGLKWADIDHIVTDDLNNPLYYARFASSIRFTRHHYAHACSAFYTSPFLEAAVLVVDGIGSADEATGQYETITTYFGSETRLTELDKTCGSFRDPEIGVLHELSDPLALYNSVGAMYKWVTLGLGFEFLEDAKTEALSAYGTRRWYERFADFYELDKDGAFRQSKTQIAQMRSFIEEELRSDDSLQAKADIAKAAQDHLECIIVTVCLQLHRKTGSDNLCMAGGVVFNRRMNASILRNTPFKRLYAFPAAGDAGTAVGSALSKYYNAVPENRLALASDPFSPCLGKAYTEESILEAAAKMEGRLELMSEQADERKLAGLLASGRIVGWFGGRSPIGPNPCGSRCVLADPRYADIKGALDRRKRRPSYLPYGAAILRDKLGRFAVSDYDAPFMEKVHTLRTEAAERLSAIAHADGTCAFLTVEEQAQPAMFRLLGAFERAAGVPILLLTSLNIHGMPMAETPLEAMEAAVQLELDYISMNGMLFRVISDENPMR